MFLAFSCEEARLKVALLCAAYRTARCKRLVMDGGGIPALRSFTRPFLRALDIYNVVLADSSRRGGVSYWQEVRRMGLRWALARSLLGRGRGRGALYPSPKRNEEYKTTHITT